MKEIDRKDELAVQALVIANATVDETYSVAKLPATGESSVGQLRSRDVGGKGANVATISARCGLRTGLIAVIGKDARGDFVRSKLAQESIVLDLIQSTRCSTDVSLINVDAHGDNTIVTTTEAAHSLEASYVCHALESLHEKCSVILQGNLTKELTQLLIGKAKKFQHRVILNPSPMWPWMKSIVPTADIVFMNAGEAFEITGKIDEAAVAMLLGNGPVQVVLTRGAKSALLGTRHPRVGKPDQLHIDRIPSIKTQAVDTTGAGDTYLAVAIASACKRGVAIDTKALTHAARAAAHTISVHGTHSAFPTSTELENILAS